MDIRVVKEALLAKMAGYRQQELKVGDAKSKLSASKIWLEVVKQQEANM